jgi:vacuolar protein sorting-associated protein 51
LVYDNYSKLIKAMETIGHMRGSMGDNVGPKASGTLVPVMGYIADTARELSREGEAQRRGSVDRKGSMEKDKKETVRWVLGAPRRLRDLLDAGKREEAEREWKDVRGLLDRWEGVKGVQEVKRECEGVMEPMAAEEKPTET